MDMHVFETIKIHNDLLSDLDADTPVYIRRLVNAINKEYEGNKMVPEINVKKYLNEMNVKQDTIKKEKKDEITRIKEEAEKKKEKYREKRRKKKEKEMAKQESSDEAKHQKKQKKKKETKETKETK
jgi:hypothetical protein